MRRFKIVRWTGCQLEEVYIVAGNAAEALQNSPMGMYDFQIISVTEIPFDPLNPPIAS